MRPQLAIATLLLAANAYAESPELAAKALHDKSCSSCHTRMYGGDGSKMYTRDGRMLSNKLELQQRVASCNAMVSSGWFPEEEELVANWLNKHYYHFEN